MDQQDFKKLYLRLFPELLVYGKTFTKDEHLIEDVIQELFMSFWENQLKYSSVISLDTYLYVSFRNNLVRRLKKAGKYVEIKEHALENQSLSEDLGPVKEEREEKLAQLIAQLPNRQREVLFLRYYKNKSYTEISEILDINYQVARNFSYRALKFLKKNMNHFSTILLSFALTLLVLPANLLP